MSVVVASLMRGLRALFVLAYVFALLGGRAQAQHVLPVLGTAPLLGRMSSTADLQERVSARRAMFETASSDLGLTDAETTELVGRIMAGQVSWVRVPRHLDEMTWAWDGSIYMYRDVVIPPDEYGWEVDLRVGPVIHALFIPAACGNLSLVERSAQISYVPPPPPPQPQCPSGMTGSPPNCYFPQCPNGMTGAPPNCYAPQPAPPPSLTKVVVKTVVRNDISWWMIPLTLIGFFFGGHFHYTIQPPPPPPPVKCPPVDP